METVPCLDLRAQYRSLRNEVLSAFEEICESTSFAQGRATSEFEAEFAAYCGVDHCVSLNSGTAQASMRMRRTIYLIDYAIVNQGLPGGLPVFAQLLGLNAAGERIFYYQYPATDCSKIYRAFPVHLENIKFPAVGPRVQNLSTRGTVSTGDNVLINGFVISGTDPRTVILRALGPSLTGGQS